MSAAAPAVEPLGVATPVASRLGRTFIRAAEFWRPGADGSLLEYGGGLHAPGSRMARISREMCFGRGEGLPGRAWETGAPVVLHQFEGSYFRRTDAARADGLSCAIALPIFLGDYLSSVVVFFCGDDDDSAGAIEVWQNDPRQSKDLSLSDGHYGRTDDTFEFIARRTSFRPGVGLPGQAWQQGLPVFLPDLGRAAAFLRADSAIRVGINRGLALPCATPGDARFVLTFLSALNTPIARRIEVWLPDAARSRLHLAAGFCESRGNLAPVAGTPAASLVRGEGRAGQAWLTGLPTLGSGLAAEPGGAAELPGLAAMVVLPVIRDARFVAAVAFAF